MTRGKSCLVLSTVTFCVHLSVAKCGKVRQKLKKGGNQILYFKAARLSKTFKDNSNKTRKEEKNQLLLHNKLHYRGVFQFGWIYIASRSKSNCGCKTALPNEIIAKIACSSVHRRKMYLQTWQRTRLAPSFPASDNSMPGEGGKSCPSRLPLYLSVCSRKFQY